jgi:hypothetical protein
MRSFTVERSGKLRINMCGRESKFSCGQGALRDVLQIPYTCSSGMLIVLRQLTPSCGGENRTGVPGAPPQGEMSL